MLEDVDRGDDVGVPDPRRDARLVQEHEGEVGLAREVWVCALDRDRSGEAGRADQAREVHGRHPAGGDLSVDGVAPDDPRLGARHEEER